jgi:hypothetical protein
MKKVIFALALLFAAITKAHAEGVPTDIFSVEGHNFESKAAAIRYVINSGKRLQVLETRCLILTNKLTFKACPKNKVSAWDNEQFAGLKVQQ